MADPSNVLALDDLKLMTGHNIRPAVATAEDVASLIGRMSRLDDAVAEAIEDEGGEDEVAGGHRHPRVGRRTPRSSSS